MCGALDRGSDCDCDGAAVGLPESASGIADRMTRVDDGAMSTLARSVLIHGLLVFGSFYIALSLAWRLIDDTFTWPPAWELAVMWLVGGCVFGVLRWATDKRVKGA